MTTGGGDVSEETRRMAEQARRAADDLPLSGVPRIATDALMARGVDMTPTEIRALAVRTLEMAQQVSYLLGKLAHLTDSPGGGP
jgi:hypothetical protein